MYVAQTIVSVLGLIALLWSEKRNFFLHATLLFLLFFFAVVRLRDPGKDGVLLLVRHSVRHDNKELSEKKVCYAVIVFRH